MDTTYDSFVILRGVIAGAISISICPSNFLTWAAFVNGIIGGSVYVLACKMSHMVEVDDTLHVSQAHGASAMYSLFSVILFHKDEGFFFKNVYYGGGKVGEAVTEGAKEMFHNFFNGKTDEVADPKTSEAFNDFFKDVKYDVPNDASEMMPAEEKFRAKIIVILGSNSLGIISVGLLTYIITCMAYKLLIQPLLDLRISQEHEIIGQDTVRHMDELKDKDRREVQNWVSEIVNQYHPNNIQDFLRQK